MSSTNSAQHLNSRFIALCDRFLHDRWRGDDALLFRARFLIGILVGYQALMAVALSFGLLFSSLPHGGKLAMAVLQGSAILALHWLQRSLRRHGNLRLAAASTLAILCLVIQAGVVMSGGPLLSPAMSAVVVPPVVAICLVGWRQGLYWGAAVFGLQLLLLVADALGVQYPNVMLPEQHETNRLLAWSIVFPALVGIVLVYESINSHLQRDRDRQHQRHEYLATHDVLTGLANRKQLVDQLRAMLLRVQRRHQVAALVYLDLDGFKHINDSHGHDGGDRVLQIVAQRLQAVARKSDVLARIGGDEFAILMDDIGSVENAEHAVRRFQQVIAQAIDDFPGCPISGSFGIAMIPTVSCDAMTLMQVADQAMYLAKKQRQILVTVNAAVATPALQVDRASADVVTLNAVPDDALAMRGDAAGTDDSPAPGALAWLQRQFVAHCDRILSPELRADPDTLIRGRTLIGMARFIQLAMLCIITTLSLTAVTVIDNVIVLAIAVFAASFSALLAYLHQSGQLSRSIDFMLLVAFVAVQGSTLINGGLAKSPALDIVVLPVLMAFCLCGRARGLIWTALTVVFHVAVGIVIGQGVDIALVTKQQLAHETVTAWGIAYCAIVFIIYLYDWINIRLQHERRREYEELEFLAAHDALTGLANRRRFHDCLTRAIERMRRTGESLAVIYLDLDGFKPVNDALGHAAGDVVLQTVARRIGNCVRAIDTVARLGGDEFGIIVEGVHSVENATQIATKILRDLARPINGLEAFAVSGSIGIALAPQHSDDGSTLVRMADQAMFSAKAVKDAVRVFQA